MKKYTKIVFVSALFFAMTANAHGGGPDIIVADPTQVDQTDVTQVDQYDYDYDATGNTKKPFLGGLRSDIDRYRAGSASKRADNLRRRAANADARALKRWNKAEKRDAQTLQALREKQARLIAASRAREAELLRRYGHLGGGKLPGANPTQVSQNNGSNIVVEPNIMQLPHGTKPGSISVDPGTPITRCDGLSQARCLDVQQTSVNPNIYTREIISHREVTWNAGDPTTPYLVRTVYVDPNAGRTPSTDEGTIEVGGKDPVIVAPNAGKDPIVVTPAIEVKPGKEPVVVAPNTGTKPGKEPVVITPAIEVKPGKDPIVVAPNTGTKPGKNPVVVAPAIEVKPGKNPVVVTPAIEVKPGKEPVVITPTQVGKNGASADNSAKESKAAAKLGKKAAKKEKKSEELAQEAAELRAKEASLKQCIAESKVTDPSQKKQACIQKVNLLQRIGLIAKKLFGKKDKKLLASSPAVSEITTSAKDPVVTPVVTPVAVEVQPTVGNDAHPELIWKAGKI